MCAKEACESLGITTDCTVAGKKQLKMRSELSLDLSSPTTMPLEMRIAEFKHNPQKMDEMTNFVDGVIREAQFEVEKKLDQKMVRN